MASSKTNPGIRLKLNWISRQATNWQNNAVVHFHAVMLLEVQLVRDKSWYWPLTQVFFPFNSKAGPSQA